MAMPGRVFPSPVGGGNSPGALTMGTGTTISSAGDWEVAMLTATENNFTVELWVKPTSTHEIDTESQSGISGVSGQKFVIDATYGGSDATRAGMGISVGTNGVSVYEHGSGYMPALLVWEGTVSGWTHIAVVYENRTPKLYVNGVLVKTGLQSVKAHVYPGKLVGSGYYGTMTGELDEVRIWSTIRTQSQIVEYMHSGVATPQSTLLAYWPISTGGSVTSLEDQSGNSHDVVLNGSYGSGNFLGAGAPVEMVAARYRYGFNGKENDNEVKGEGNQQDYGMRIYDPRLGRFLSEDPITAEYPELTPYQFASNTPVVAIDLDGLESIITTVGARSTPIIRNPTIRHVGNQVVNAASRINVENWNKLSPRIQELLKTAANGRAQHSAWRQVQELDGFRTEYAVSGGRIDAFRIVPCWT